MEIRLRDHRLHFVSRRTKACGVQETGTHSVSGSTTRELCRVPRDTFGTRDVGPGGIGLGRSVGTSRVTEVGGRDVWGPGEGEMVGEGVDLFVGVGATGEVEGESREGTDPARPRAEPVTHGISGNSKSTEATFYPYHRRPKYPNHSPLRKGPSVTGRAAPVAVSIGNHSWTTHDP